MISEQVQKQAVWFHGKPHYPINQCMHCGAEDDPEGAWRFDDDDDRICLQCAEQEGIEAQKEAV